MFWLISKYIVCAEVLVFIVLVSVYKMWLLWFMSVFSCSDMFGRGTSDPHTFLIRDKDYVFDSGEIHGV
jgi:hypothetical protein